MRLKGQYHEHVVSESLNRKCYSTYGTFYESLTLLIKHETGNHCTILTNKESSLHTCMYLRNAQPLLLTMWQVTQNRKHNSFVVTVET
jgi:hypothetical protein